jgi:hypothetical protein
MKVMVPALIGIVMLISAPTFGQIIKPTLTPPPCSGQGCRVQKRGEVTPNPRKQGTTCPPGTVYDGYKGTCRVMPANPN